MGLQAGPISALSNEARSKEHLESWGIIARGALPTLISKGTSSAASSTNPLALHPGCIISLEGPTGLGLTRVGLSMIAEASQHAPVVVVDVRGWICPLAAWETGVRSDRLAIVRCGDVIQWPGALAALLEGVKAIYAEVPVGVPGGVLRRLSALARSRNAGLVLRPLKGQLPSGVAYLRVRAEKVSPGLEITSPNAGSFTAFGGACVSRHRPAQRTTPAGSVCGEAPRSPLV